MCLFSFLDIKINSNSLKKNPIKFLLIYKFNFRIFLQSMSNMENSCEKLLNIRFDKELKSEEF